MEENKKYDQKLYKQRRRSPAEIYEYFRRKLSEAVEAGLLILLDPTADPAFDTAAANSGNYIFARKFEYERDIDDFVRASKQSLKLLETMEADIEKSRKIFSIKNKIKDHVKKVEDEMLSCEEALPPKLTNILKIFSTRFGPYERGSLEYCTFSEEDDKMEKDGALKVIRNCREELKSFIQDPLSWKYDWMRQLQQ